MDGFDLAALDTLQHRLPGHAQSRGRFQHGDVAWWRLLNETGDAVRR